MFVAGIFGVITALGVNGSVAARALPAAGVFSFPFHTLYIGVQFQAVTDIPTALFDTSLEYVASYSIFSALTLSASEKLTTFSGRAAGSVCLDSRYLSTLSFAVFTLCTVPSFQIRFIR